MGLLGAGISAASSLASGFGESSTYNQNAMKCGCMEISKTQKGA